MADFFHFRRVIGSHLFVGGRKAAALEALHLLRTLLAAGTSESSTLKHLLEIFVQSLTLLLVLELAEGSLRSEEASFG